jgi:Predicted secreted Zn-dependent protease
MRAGRIAVAFIALAGLALPAAAETIVSKSYSYFNIGGHTAKELDAELSRRGPQMKSTGSRHPGATQMKFSGDVTYEIRGGRCRVKDARVKLQTKIILPRWTGRKRADEGLVLIWDTLSRDIKRHEERHAEIARQHARKLEGSLLALPARETCEEVQAEVSKQSDKLLVEHDRAQSAFDRAEAASFERRMMRMLKFRVDAMRAK